MQSDAMGWVRKKLDGADAGVSPRREAPSEGLTTFIDRGAEFEGTLRLRSTARIDGEFRGAIECEGTVIIGEAAGVEADVRAREVLIGGAVAGSVNASRQLVLRPTGRLQGDVQTPSLTIEKGAVFNGSSSMTRPEIAARNAAATPRKAAPAKPAAKPPAPSASV